MNIIPVLVAVVLFIAVFVALIGIGLLFFKVLLKSIKKDEVDTYHRWDVEG